LVRGGVTDFALNTHYLPDAVAACLHAVEGRGRFSARPDLPVQLFHEPSLLGTGGALLNARSYWGASPLLVWNADILADVDPAVLMAAHRSAPQSGPPATPAIQGATLATLAVSDRPASSRLLFDAQGVLCGIDSPRRNDHRVLREPRDAMMAKAFHGISVLDAALLDVMLRRHAPGSAFDLIDLLLDAVASGGLVRAHDAGAGFWGSTGTPVELERLERELGQRPELLACWTPAPTPADEPGPARKLASRGEGEKDS
jgi:NDP-sugar pyrophosphorylase family protein